MLDDKGKPLEQWLRGKAVLASNAGGIRELLRTSDACLLFEPDDAEDFCRQATRLLVSFCRETLILAKFLTVQ